MWVFLKDAFSKDKDVFQMEVNQNAELTQSVRLKLLSADSTPGHLVRLLSFSRPGAMLCVVRADSHREERGKPRKTGSRI